MNPIIVGYLVSFRGVGGLVFVSPVQDLLPFLEVKLWETSTLKIAKPKIGLQFHKEKGTHDQFLKILD
jgi:hypothetical protein